MSISLGLDLARAEAVIEIVDGGPGIPEQDLDRIFDRFERAAPSRHFGGLGLGLYLSRRIVEAHGGAIRASNRPTGGARFTITLPMRAAASAPPPYEGLST